jgi:hypothetical protein
MRSPSTIFARQYVFKLFDHFVHVGRLHGPGKFPVYNLPRTICEWGFKLRSEELVTTNSISGSAGWFDLPNNTFFGITPSSVSTSETGRYDVLTIV